MFPRPIASLKIPQLAITTLRNSGFFSVSDLSTITAEQLSEGMTPVILVASHHLHKLLLDVDLPISLCTEIIKAVNSGTDLPTTQSASALLSSVGPPYLLCEPLNELMGGLNRGSVVELSGPPGSPKELVLLDLVRAAVQEDEEVLFIGKQSIYFVTNNNVHFSEDAQNAVLPHSLRFILKGQ